MQVWLRRRLSSHALRIASNTAVDGANVDVDDDTHGHDYCVRFRPVYARTA